MSGIRAGPGGPDQVPRWTWLIIAAITQFRLARPPARPAAAGNAAAARESSAPDGSAAISAAWPHKPERRPAR